MTIDVVPYIWNFFIAGSWWRKQIPLLFSAIHHLNNFDSEASGRAAYQPESTDWQAFLIQRFSVLIYDILYVDPLGKYTKYLRLHIVEIQFLSFASRNLRLKAASKNEE